MARGKKMTRRLWPQPGAVHGFDADDDLLSDIDLEDDLGDLERMLGDPLDRVVMAIARPPRPIRVRHDELSSSMLTRAWCARVGDCGAGATRRERGIEYLIRGAVQDLRVGPRRLVATVLGSRRHHVEVEVRLPPRADMQAALERVEQARAALTGADPRLAMRLAILSGGPGLFPSPAQLHRECSCLEGPGCKHVVAAVWAFGVLLDREPDQLLVLWDLDAKDPRATGVFVLPPLAADKRPLVDGLEIFGVDLVESSAPPIAMVPLRAPLPAPAKVVAAPKPAPPVVVEAPSQLPPSQQAEVRREYLRMIGIPARTIDTWLRSGVLRESAEAGVYARTPEASQKIADFLAR